MEPFDENRQRIGPFMEVAKLARQRFPRRQGGLDIGFDVIVLLIFTLVVPFVVATANRIYADGDVSWHIAAGQWMIDHGTVPRTDPFSFSAAGKPWVAHEWLSELIMGAAYKVAGFAGVAALVVTALSALMLVLWTELSRWTRPVVTGAILLAVTITLIPFLHARPMVLTWPFLASWTVQMMHARERERAPPLWLAAVMVAWANLHASFSLGLVIIGPFALEALLEERDKTRAFVGWGSFGVLCVIGCLLNPNTYTVLLMPIAAFTDKNITLIQEFRPTDMSFTPGFEAALLLLLAIGLGRGAVVKPLRLVALLGFLHLALQHMRHQVLFMIVAALLIGPSLPPQAELAEQSAERRRGIFGKAVAAFLLLIGVTLARPADPPESSVNPTSAIVAVPTELRVQPVLNSYSLGGPLILHGIRPFIDGRTDVYGDQFVIDYHRFLDGDASALAEAQKRYHFRWALIAKDDRKMLNLLEHTPEWRTIRSDANAITLVRS